MNKHISVLLREAIDYLNIKDNGTYVDATLGYAGHSSEILKRIPNGLLIAFDKDDYAIECSCKKLSTIGNNFKLYNESFSNIKKVLNESLVKADGILFDLGVSSVEIDDPERGFSYMKDGPLDMRMDKSSKLTAYEVINTYDISSLTKIFREYGEEKHALKIAKEIVFEREKNKISTTKALVDIIDRCYPYKEKRNGHPAKKVFQALRIEVNNELEELEQALSDSLKLLNVHGRVVVITFHSLEDRICKNIFKKATEIDPVVKGMPNISDDLLPDYKLIVNKPIIPSEEELNNNSRSRSAKMRIIERIK